MSPIERKALLDRLKGYQDHLEQPLATEFKVTFWPRYPQKIGKANAFKAFCAARKRVELEPMMAGLERYIRDKPTERDWCHPSTWLNQDRWLDEPAPAPKKRGNGLEGYAELLQIDLEECIERAKRDKQGSDQ